MKKFSGVGQKLEVGEPAFQGQRLGPFLGDGHAVGRGDLAGESEHRSPNVSVLSQEITKSSKMWPCLCL